MLQLSKSQLPAKKCEGCPCVKGVRIGCLGNPSADIAIVVDGPGTIALKNRCLIAGDFETFLLGQLPKDIDPIKDLYFIGATQCRMPMIADPHKKKAFNFSAITACRERVLAELWQYPRKVVVAMGASGAIAVTGNYNIKITQARGVVQKIQSPFGETYFYPMVSLGYMLRGGNLETFSLDIREVFKLLKTGVSRQEQWKPPRIKVIESADELWEISQKIADYGVSQGFDKTIVSGDFETSGFNPWIDYILDFGFYYSGEDIAYIIDPPMMEQKPFREAMFHFLTHPEIKWNWQNGKFDIRFAWLKGWIPFGMDIIHEDTLLLSYALNEASKAHDLDEQAKNRLGAPEHKADIKRWVSNKRASYANIPTPVRHDYLSKDLKKTHEIFASTRVQVETDADCDLLYTKTLIPTASFLCEVEIKGIAVDLDYVRINHTGAIQADVDAGRITQKDLATEIGLDLEIDLALKELWKEAGYEVNPNSPQQVKKLLYDRLKLKIKGKTPDDTRKETLDKLPPHPVVKSIRKIRSLDKMRATYVVAIEKRVVNGRIHTIFKLHITPTGRLSSSEPNIQNIPRGSRWKRMYCAPKGRRLIEADYNSAELRGLAAISGDKLLTEIFLDDKRNLHDEVSIEMYGTGFTEDQRIRAKAINFGIPYGREAFSIATEFDMPAEEAQELIDKWLARFPEAAKYLKWARSRPQAGEPLITVFGRKRRPGVVSPERLHGLKNEFANFGMQSIITDFNAHSAMRSHKEFQARKLDAHCVNLVHDSQLVEICDDDDVQAEVCEIMKRNMEQVPRDWLDTPITFRADFKVGTHWGLLKKLKV